jgi:hypothetical protein
MKLTAIGISCGRLGLCVTSLSVELDPAFLSATNASEAITKLRITAEDFKILKDGYYVNVRPRAEVLVGLLQTHLAHELQQLQQPSASASLMLVGALLFECKIWVLLVHSCHHALPNRSMLFLLSSCCHYVTSTCQHNMGHISFLDQPV